MDRMDDLMKRVEAAREELERWPQKDLELSEHIPTEGLCSICYLSGLRSGGQEEQRRHIVIILCPSPGAFIQTYRWSGDRLVVDQKLIADSTAVEETVKGLVDLYVGKGPTDRAHNGDSPEASGP